jgi:hypothetical protein
MTLAATFFRPGEYGRITLRVFRGPAGTPLLEYPHGHGRWGFTLSKDGRLLARQISNRQVEVRDLATGSVLVTKQGRCHQSVQAAWGDRCLYTRVGSWIHTIRWGGATLLIRENRHAHQPFEADELAGIGLNVNSFIKNQSRSWPSYSWYDADRFQAGFRLTDMIVGTDRHGHLVLLHPNGSLLAMFFIFRNEVAAWLPDGTRFGPASITGGPETPGALEKIARTLRQASAVKER